MGGFRESEGGMSSYRAFLTSGIVSGVILGVDPGYIGFIAIGFISVLYIGLISALYRPYIGLISDCIGLYWAVHQHFIYPPFCQKQRV